MAEEQADDMPRRKGARPSNPRPSPAPAARFDRPESDEAPWLTTLEDLFIRLGTRPKPRLEGDDVEDDRGSPTTKNSATSPSPPRPIPADGATPK